MNLLGQAAARLRLELRFAVSLVVLVGVSYALLIPAVFYRPIWHKYQNRVADWVEEWGIEPLRRHKVST